MPERRRSHPEAGTAPAGATGTTAAVDAGPPAQAERSRRNSIRSAFDRAAASYDEAAHVQREICARLARFAAAPGCTPPHPPARRSWTPAAAPALRPRGPGAALPGRAPRIALDLAPWMLHQARRRHAALHPRALRAPGAASRPVAPSRARRRRPAARAVRRPRTPPLASASVGLVWSSLAMQWCEPTRTLAECARVLAAGGLALVATLGPRTLWELREAFALIDDARHTIDFQPQAHWLAAAQHAGLAVEASDSAEVHAARRTCAACCRTSSASAPPPSMAGAVAQPLGRAAWSRLQAACAPPPARWPPPRPTT